MRHYLKRFFALFLILAIGLTSMQSAEASKISKAKRERQKATEALKAEQKLMKKITAKREKLEKEINAVDKELVNIMTDIQITKEDISDKKKEIAKLKKKKQKTETEIENQKEAIKKQVKFMYENGNRDIADVVLTSKSISGMLNSVEYYNDIYEYGNNLLNNYKSNLKKVKNLKKQAESEKSELVAIKETYVEQKGELRALKAKKKTKLKNYKQQLRKAKKLSVKYKSTIRKQNQIIREELARIEAERQAELARLAAEAEARARREREAAQAAQAAAEAAAKQEKQTASVVTTSSKGSAAGQEIADYGCKFIGNKYVWGGTSLTNGTDCSGFVQQVYYHFGYTDCPRTSAAQRSYGREVSYADAQPGDIICYSGHVGIYIGNNQIVNASNSKPYPEGGIKITTATYRTILSVRRVVN